MILEKDRGVLAHMPLFLPKISCIVRDVLKPRARELTLFKPVRGSSVPDQYLVLAVIVV